MSRWFPEVRKGALALILAGLLADCGGGGSGGGGGALRLFFGMLGDGSCSRVVVNVDLAGAGAILARKSGGGPDCTLDPALANGGCLVNFDELNNGESLRVTVAGCTIPEVTNLFSCLFSQVDISDLNVDTNAQCTCKEPGCDETPPLCIDEDANPRSCEDCGNGVDDDGNGEADCDDPSCEHLPPCEGGGPGSTSTSSTTPTEPLTINFTLTSSSAPVGDLQFTVNYTSAPGQFDGSGTAVVCSSKVAGATFAPNDKDSIRKLLLHLTKASGFSAPTALVSCQFLPRDPVPVPANFTVVINSATGTNGAPVTVKIKVTTGDSTTTTTEEPVTTTTLPPQPIAVNLSLTSSSAPVADLQFKVNYTSAKGEFEGSGSSVNCTNEVGGATLLASDNDSTRRLSLALARPSGFSAPEELVSCRFLPGTPAPAAANFSIVLDSAKGINEQPVTVALKVTLAAVP